VIEHRRLFLELCSAGRHAVDCLTSGVLHLVLAGRYSGKYCPVALVANLMRAQGSQEEAGALLFARESGLEAARVRGAKLVVPSLDGHAPHRILIVNFAFNSLLFPNGHLFDEIVA